MLVSITKHRYPFADLSSLIRFSCMLVDIVLVRPTIFTLFMEPSFEAVKLMRFCTAADQTCCLFLMCFDPLVFNATQTGIFQRMNSKCGGPHAGKNSPTTKIMGMMETAPNWPSRCQTPIATPMR
jgi:hypothetical protein